MWKYLNILENQRRFCFLTNFEDKPLKQLRNCEISHQPLLLPQHVEEDQSVHSTSFVSCKFWPKVADTLTKLH